MAKSKYDESLPERAGEYAAVHPLHPGFVTAWARAVARLVKRTPLKDNPKCRSEEARDCGTDGCPVYSAAAGLSKMGKPAVAGVETFAPLAGPASAGVES